MGQNSQIQESVTVAILQLRKDTHAKGFPFMINTVDLPTHQCYLEYPDGSIRLVYAKNNDFADVRKLSKREQKIIREKYIAAWI